MSDFARQFLDVLALEQSVLVPHTVAMDRRLESLDESSRVVGVKNGQPVVEARSGRRMVLTTLGHLERA